MAFHKVHFLAALFLCGLCIKNVTSLDFVDLLNLYMDTAEENRNPAAKRGSMNEVEMDYYGDEQQVPGLSDSDLWKYLGVSGNSRDQFSVNRRASSVQENVYSGTCGLRPESRPEDVSKRIAVGQQSTKSWPWQAEFILRNSNGRPKHHCGGTLLNENYILTAAHCFNDWGKDEMFVRLGEYDRKHAQGVGPYEQNKDLECVFVHEDYKQHPAPKYLENDLALVRVSTPVTITDYVRPACLPEKNEFKAGDKCYVTGWGYTDPMRYLMKDKPKVLREAYVPLLSEDSCQIAYGDIINDAMVCAGSLSGGARPDSCKGDSGGPLVCQGKSGAWKLWGVVSWGWNYFCKPSPPEPEPTVYARVETFLKWIEEKVTSGTC